MANRTVRHQTYHNSSSEMVRVGLRVNPIKNRCFQVKGRKTKWLGSVDIHEIPEKEFSSKILNLEG